jgi:hypothetical protein
MPHLLVKKARGLEDLLFLFPAIFLRGLGCAARKVILALKSEVERGKRGGEKN